MSDFNDGIPRVIDPGYLKYKYMLTIAELESFFGELRNADDAGRLQIISETLEQADPWIDGLYAEIGITPEIRAQADEVQVQLMDTITRIFGGDGSPSIDDLL